MTISKLPDADFERYHGLSSKLERANTIASNDAFTAAMNKAIVKGRESVKPGTYVDLSPAINALRIRGTVEISGCGSPAAMCLDAGGAHSGAEAMK